MLLLFFIIFNKIMHYLFGQNNGLTFLYVCYFYVFTVAYLLVFNPFKFTNRNYLKTFMQLATSLVSPISQI